MKHTNEIRAESFSFERVTDRRPQHGGAGVHYHGCYEVYYLLEGTCWYFIDKKSYYLTAGDIALIPRGALHKTAYETPTYSRLLIWCDESFIPESVREAVFENGYFSGKGEQGARVAELYAAIEREWTAADAFSSDAIRAYLGELFVLIARGVQSNKVKKEESPIVECAVRYIHAHFAEPITLGAVAAACYTGREHLSRTFKRATGFGFSEYLTAYRLKHAQAMLLSRPSQRISDVALSCGFSDGNYFSKVYRRVYGITPTEERAARNEREILAKTKYL
jgi:AraC-like DNA-binding protein